MMGLGDWIMVGGLLAWLCSIGASFAYLSCQDKRDEFPNNPALW